MSIRLTEEEAMQVVMAREGIIARFQASVDRPGIPRHCGKDTSAQGRRRGAVNDRLRGVVNRGAAGPSFPRPTAAMPNPR